MVRYIALFGVLLGAAACERDAAPPTPGEAPVPVPATELPGDTGIPVVPQERAVDETVPPAPSPPTMGPGGAIEPAERPVPPRQGVPSTGAGQQPQPITQEPARDEGAEVLRRASAAYESVRSMRAEFVMNFNNPLLRQTTTSRGTLYQQRPDRIALRFSDPDGDVILSDGEYFYMFQPSIDPRQATRAPAGASTGGGVDLQAQFIGNPVERFEYTLEGVETVGGRAAHVMTLVPRQRAEYRALKVWLDTRDSLARRFEITEHNGSVRRFDLTGLQTNAAIPDGIFRFTPPEGVRIVNVG